MTKKKVLQDHKRHGKTFIPPFQHMLGPLKEISWVKTMLPELIWIALIQDYYGHREGVALITKFTRVARECSPSEKKRIFATISSFEELNKEEQSCLKNELESSGDFFEIQKAILPLIAFYPECPLRFLYSSEQNLSGEEKRNLELLKTMVGGMYNKVSRNTMMVQQSGLHSTLVH